jgi:hypothetical protein
MADAVPRSAFTVATELLIARVEATSRELTLRAELRQITGMEFEEFRDHMTALLGSIEVSEVVIDDKGNVVARRVIETPDGPDMVDVRLTHRHAYAEEITR